MTQAERQQMKAKLIEVGIWGARIKGASATDAPTLLAVVRAADGGVVIEGRQ